MSQKTVAILGNVYLLKYAQYIIRKFLFILLFSKLSFWLYTEYYGRVIDIGSSANIVFDV